MIAEINTDEGGNFTFELGDNERYNGEAFEVDIYCGTVPRLKLACSRQRRCNFPLRPCSRWRQAGTVGRVGLLPAVSLLVSGAWALRRVEQSADGVTHCATGAPIPNVKVRGFDVDQLQDDDLGSAITDINGEFRIDYLASDFQQTIFSFIQLERVGGPTSISKSKLRRRALLTEPPAARP